MGLLETFNIQATTFQSLPPRPHGHLCHSIKYIQPILENPCNLAGFNIVQGSYLETESYIVRSCTFFKAIHTSL